MPCSGCSGLHGVNPNFFKKINRTQTYFSVKHYLLSKGTFGSTFPNKNQKFLYKTTRVLAFLFEKFLKNMNYRISSNYKGGLRSIPS